jgi:subtilase family serine protease
MLRTRAYISAVSAMLLLTGNSIAQGLIRDKVDENKLVTLAGNTRPEANADNDLGPVGDDLKLDHMMLQLKRSPEQEKAAAKFVDDLHDRKSANFHKWISATEFGKNFGVAESDIRTITGWLESHGFVVNTVYPSGMVIDFSGSAGQVARAFHTSIHNLDVDGVRHIANVSDPRIPAALAPAVEGVVSLHNFRPHSAVRPRASYSFTFQGTPGFGVVPADLATIYDFNPLFNKGTTGAGQTIVVLEDTDLYSSQDWNTFRSTFGLSQYSAGSLTTSHPAPPSGVNNCYDPGVNDDDSEAIIDAEWASAAAPGAAIVVGACGDTETSFGVYIAMQNLVNGSNPPSIMSISYVECEAENGAAANSAVSGLYQQAVAEGVSVFVAAGDGGAAACDMDQSIAIHGISVNGLASTAYNLAAGGTDFSAGLDGTTSTYWSTTNTSSYGSAMSYIPEIPWNGTCASALMANYFGYSTVYGDDGFCNSDTAIENGFNLATGVGSGGPSNCATGASTSFGFSNGSCKGAPKPSWQTGLPGIPKDGVRDLPDVSMFASNGIWESYYVECFSDPDNGGARCVGAPSNWGGGGGTSFVAPILAGVQALVNQSAGGAQGNPNPVYYALAAGANASSIFHSVTRGDIDVNCGGKVNCFGSTILTGWGREGRGITAGAPGALSVSSTTFTPAYSTGPSWNFATGIGSVDVNNLVTNWINQ